MRAGDLLVPAVPIQCTFEAVLGHSQVAKVSVKSLRLKGAFFGDFTQLSAAVKKERHPIASFF